MRLVEDGRQATRWRRRISVQNLLLKFWLQAWFNWSIQHSFAWGTDKKRSYIWAEERILKIWFESLRTSNVTLSLYLQYKYWCRMRYRMCSYIWKSTDEKRDVDCTVCCAGPNASNSLICESRPFWWLLWMISCTMNARIKSSLAALRLSPPSFLTHSR